jgi:hypothetical protein
MALFFKALTAKSKTTAWAWVMGIFMAQAMRRSTADCRCEYSGV